MSESKLVLACYDEKTLVERSKKLKTLVEDRLHSVNLQMSFPLFPTYVSKIDVFTKSTGNSGYLGHLARSSKEFASEWMVAGRSSEVKSIKLEDFKLEAGLPYEIVNIGPPLDMKRKFHPTRKVEVREVEVIRNPIFFYGACYPPSGPAALRHKSLAFVHYVPIISETTWKQLNIELAKRYPANKDRILEQLWVSSGDMDTAVRSILNEDRNSGLRDMFVEVRRSLNNVSNAAYIEAMIASLLGYLSALDWCPLFPKLYDTGRGQDKLASLDKNVAPLWTEYLITQYTDNYYADVIAIHDHIDAEMLMAHLFQIVYGLDFAQRALGFIHRDLNIKKAVGYVKVDPKLYLYYKWQGRFYQVPSFGKIIKLINFDRSSITVGNVRHTSDRAAEARLSPKSDNFNVDLLRLGATLRAALKQKNMKLTSPHAQVSEALMNMLNDFVTCFNDPDKTQMSGKEVNMIEYRNKCLESDDVGGNCDWKAFFSVPSELECTKALPSAQVKYFEMFEIPMSKIPRNAIVYTLE